MLDIRYILLVGLESVSINMEAEMMPLSHHRPRYFLSY